MNFPEITTSINIVEEEIKTVVTKIEEIEQKYIEIDTEIKKKNDNSTTTSSGKYSNYTKGELNKEKKYLQKKELSIRDEKQSLRDEKILLLKKEQYLNNGTNTSANTVAGQGKYIILYHL
jgi:phage-related minor tail protein